MKLFFVFIFLFFCNSLEILGFFAKFEEKLQEAKITLLIDSKREGDEISIYVSKDNDEQNSFNEQFFKENTNSDACLGFWKNELSYGNGWTVQEISAAKTIFMKIIPFEQLKSCLGVEKKSIDQFLYFEAIFHASVKSGETKNSFEPQKMHLFTHQNNNALNAHTIHTIKYLGQESQEIKAKNEVSYQFFFAVHFPYQEIGGNLKLLNQNAFILQNTIFFDSAKGDDDNNSTKTRIEFSMLENSANLPSNITLNPIQSFHSQLFKATVVSSVENEFRRETIGQIQYSYQEIPQKFNFSITATSYSPKPIDLPKLVDGEKEAIKVVVKKKPEGKIILTKETEFLMSIESNQEFSNDTVIDICNITKIIVSTTPKDNYTLFDIESNEGDVLELGKMMDLTIQGMKNEENYEFDIKMKFGVNINAKKPISLYQSLTKNQGKAKLVVQFNLIYRNEGTTNGGNMNRVIIEDSIEILVSTTDQYHSIALEDQKIIENKIQQTQNQVELCKYQFFIAIFVPDIKNSLFQSFDVVLDQINAPNPKTTTEEQISKFNISESWISIPATNGDSNGFKKKIVFLEVSSLCWIKGNEIKSSNFQVMVNFSNEIEDFHKSKRIDVPLTYRNHSTDELEVNWISGTVNKEEKSINFALRIEGCQEYHFVKSIIHCGTKKFVLEQGNALEVTPETQNLKDNKETEKKIIEVSTLIRFGNINEEERKEELIYCLQEKNGSLIYAFQFKINNHTLLVSEKEFQLSENFMNELSDLLESAAMSWKMYTTLFVGIFVVLMVFQVW